MKNTLPARVRFGAFELDLKAGELRLAAEAEGESRIVLPDQPFRLLVMLVEREGELVNREEIRKKLWPNDTIVEFDHSINAVIRNLRRALKDSADEPKYIETLARRGYRLMVAVQWIGPGSDQPSSGALSSSDSGVAVRLQPDPGVMTGKTVSHYRVLNIIGGGGMGVVYRAEDLKLGRRVALKFLPAELATDPAALRRFEREARTASSLNHPNICTIYEVEEHDSQPFIAMELLEGETLRDRLGAPKSGVKAMAIEELLGIALQVADGLQAAHDKGIIHRDIKPANILLTASGQVKILDFGLAKLTMSEEALGDSIALYPLTKIGEKDGAHKPGALDPTLSRTGAAIGTAGYMSPEQARGEKLDARSDIFSFGLVLYEMATGQRAFSGETAAILRDAIVNLEPNSLRELVHEAPPKLEAIIVKCLEKGREKRYPSAAAIRQELLRVGHAQEVPEPGPSRHVWKWAAAAALLSASAVGGWMYWRLRHASTLTEKDTIVLADFVNTTGDAVFDDALKQALTIQLEQSPSLSVLSDRKVIETLKLMNRPVNDRIIKKVAEEVCLRNNSKVLLEGSISAIGDHYLITLKAMNCQTGDTIASADAEAVNRNQVVKMLGEASNQLRKKLGEPRPSIEKYNTPLEEATTSSLEALEAFTQSMKVRTEPVRAIPFLQRALHMDPNFARAYALLGVAYYNLGETSAAIENFNKAYELRDRVSQRERLTIEGFHYGFVTGQIEKAVEIYSEWVQTYPEDHTPHAVLGIIYAELGQYEKAAVEMRERIRLSSEHSDYNLVGIYACLNRLDDAQALLDQAREHDGPYLREIRYTLAFLRGDDAAMREHVAFARGKLGVEDWLLSAQSDTEAYHGRLAKARQLSEEAVQSARRAELLETAASWRANEALREAEIGNAVGARQRTVEALGLRSGPDVEVKAALALARAGGAARARSLVDKLDREFPQDTRIQSYWLPTIRAAIELGKPNSDKAIGTLRVVMPYDLGSAAMDNASPGILVFGNLYPVYIRGLAYLKAGQDQLATAEFQKILEHRGIMGNFILGPLARLQLGRALAMMGDKAAARKSYQEFLTLWKDADPDIPIYQQAKTEYAKLR
jgi:serine/threonine protein kinase/Flp pilus assembly protein TadD